VKLVIVAPHFEPDVAPTGEVITRIVHELGRRGHTIDVLTALPWYRSHRIEPGFGGRLWRYEDRPWGRITRIHPFPTADKRNLVRRGAAFAAFSAIAAAMGMRHVGADLASDPSDREQWSCDGVLALSPPLTLGVAGRAIATARRAPFVFRVDDVFPDVAVELGVLRNRIVVEAARSLERWCYDHADAVTVLSDDMRDNVGRKSHRPESVRVIPNFVDTDAIRPGPIQNGYRREFGLEGKTVVMYAGNVGFSQSLELVVEAASALAYEDDVVFVINGAGSSREQLEHKARGMPNVRFIDMQPLERLPELLAAGDIHVVPLKRGLARSSVPSKMYSIFAAGRPLLASVDDGSEIARVLAESGAGVAVPPDDAEAFTKALRDLLDHPEAGPRMGAAGRAWVERWASPAGIARAYEELFEELRRQR
jgi:colanic acid biosynthesis glycosyl transferase WcaI